MKNQSGSELDDGHVAASNGKFEQLLEAVYDELRQIARFQRLNEPPDLTLQTTALVHEAYLRLVNSESVPQPHNERHMKALTSRVIRRVIVDHARQRNAHKRDPDRMPVYLEELDLIDPKMAVDVLDLEAAIRQLAQRSPDLERVVELRFFGGLSSDEIAVEMNISARTAHRYWQKARLYLLEFLHSAESTSQTTTRAER